MKFEKRQSGEVVQWTTAGYIRVIYNTGKITPTAAGLTEDEIVEAFKVYKQPGKPDPEKLAAHNQYAVIRPDGTVYDYYYNENAARNDLKGNGDVVARIWLEVLT